MTTLIIARHGNTFDSEDTPTRVGARTDLPLVKSGQKQAEYIGLYLKKYNLKPDQIFTSNLQRTIQTAEIAMKTADWGIPIQQNSIFNEIDYGPDENKPENEVIARIGAQAIKDWDERAIIPDGWIADPAQIIQDWKDFACNLPENSTTLIVTSNGIARFAPHITADFDNFATKNKIKLSTGALALLSYRNGEWMIDQWNLKP